MRLKGGWEPLGELAQPGSLKPSLVSLLVSLAVGRQCVIVRRSAAVPGSQRSINKGDCNKVHLIAAPCNSVQKGLVIRCSIRLSYALLFTPTVTG